MTLLPMHNLHCTISASGNSIICGGSIINNTSSNLREICHQAATSLNNTAVALMTDGFAREAADMLEDVKQFMLYMPTSTGESHSTSSNPLNEKKLYDQVHQALHRACQLEATTKLAARNETLSLHRLLTMSQWPTRLHVLSTLAPPADGYTLVAASELSASTCPRLFPMTIDPLNAITQKRNNKDTTRFILAVVIHNYGISLQFVTDRTFNGKATYCSMSRIRCLWRSASALLFAMEQEHERSTSLSDFAGPIQTLHLILNHSLVHLALDLQLLDEYEWYRYALQRRLRSVKSQVLGTRSTPE